MAENERERSGSKCEHQVLDMVLEMVFYRNSGLYPTFLSISVKLKLFQGIVGKVYRD